MAKRRKSKKSKGRRRKVGALALNAKSPVVQIGAAAAGFFFADKINPMIDKVTGTMDPKLVAAIQTGLGAALVFMKLGKKKTTVEVIAGGVLAGAGLKRALAAFGIMNGIGGYGKVQVIGKRRMGGYLDVETVGYTPTQSLNGYRVPRPMHQQVMGNANGSGLNSQSGYMN